MQALEEKLDTLTLPNKKGWPQRPKRAVGKKVRSYFAERKRNKTIGPNYPIVRRERQGGKNPQFGEKEEGQTESME